MKYSFILLDADNTIFDFDAAERVALELAFKQNGVDPTDELLATYHVINIKYWAMLAENKIEKNRLYYERFIELFSRFSITADAIAVQADYRRYLSEQCILLDGAKEFLEKLHQNYKLYMITNGDVMTQRRRIKNSGISDFFSDVFISDEIGHEKPERAFFDYVATHIPDFSTDKCLLIGDGIKTDIVGGVNYGIDCVWFNPLHLENTTGVTPDFTTYGFDETVGLLDRIDGQPQ